MSNEYTHSITKESYFLYVVNEIINNEEKPIVAFTFRLEAIKYLEKLNIKNYIDKTEEDD